jgi:ATP synthase protein I
MRIAGCCLVDPESEKHDEQTGPRSLEARLKRLSASLDAQSSGSDESADRSAGDKSLGGAMSLGFRVMSEFVAGVAVGALIGWQLDSWFKTTPILLIVFLTLGTAAGFWNVYRIASKPTARGPL